nr:MAG TPA: hypothetical protein [Podoviridae sp. ctgHy19]
MEPRRFICILSKDKLCVFAISSGHKNAFLQLRRAEGE